MQSNADPVPHVSLDLSCDLRASPAFDTTPHARLNFVAKRSLTRWMSVHRGHSARCLRNGLLLFSHSRAAVISAGLRFRRVTLSGTPIADSVCLSCRYTQSIRPMNKNHFKLARLISLTCLSGEQNHAEHSAPAVRGLCDRRGPAIAAGLCRWPPGRTPVSKLLVARPPGPVPAA